MRYLTTLLSAAAVLCALSSVAAAQNSHGDALFKENCLMCHGADGAGTPTGKALKAAPFQSPAVEKMSDAELATIIHNGKNNMPEFGNRLTSPQIDSLVSYIRQLQKK